MVGTPVTWTAAVQNGPARPYLRLSIHRDFQRPVTDRPRLQPHQNLPLGAAHSRRCVPGQRGCARHHRFAVRLFAPVSVSFNLLPWVTAPLAAGVVNPTSHPLVALFSGPPCAAGHQLLVRFHPATSSTSMTTNLVPCSPNSANFYIAGMYPSTQYLMHWEEYAGTTLVNTGTDLPFTTGALPSNFVTAHVSGQRPAHRGRRGLSSGRVSAQPSIHVNRDRPRRECDLVCLPAPRARIEPGGYFYSYPGSRFRAI